MALAEQARVFQGEKATLIGILHPVSGSARIGVLLVVGGPQYRVGSHRQFVLLARFLAARGVPVMRFDYQGMGDSDGDLLSFESVAGDINAAIDLYCRELALSGVVIWGLCDAASAALLHAVDDPRVEGLVLLNPWVRTESSLAKAYVQHYYRTRFLQWSTWRGLLSGRINPWRSARSFLTQWWRSKNHHDSPREQPLSLPARMAQGLARFGGPVLIILSGEDLTAQEFEDTARESAEWQALLADERVRLQRLAGANHTFARAEWRDQVANWTLEWLSTQVIS